MKKTKKILSIALVLAMTLSTNTMTAFALDQPLSREEIRQDYLSDPEFYEYYLEYPTEANKIIADAIKGLSKPVSEDYLNTRAGNPETTHAWVNTRLIKQPNGYYCGPTSALMSVIGWGGEDAVDGNTDNEKIETIAKMLGTTNSGTVPARIATELNEILGSASYHYSAFVHTALTEHQFRAYIFNSLVKDRAPIIHVRTEHLPYYNGYDTGHFITVTSYNYDVKNEMTLYDCNNRAEYFGIHQVAWEDAYAGQTDNSHGNRYLIASF